MPRTVEEVQRTDRVLKRLLEKGQCCSQEVLAHINRDLARQHLPRFADTHSLYRYRKRYWVRQKEPETEFRVTLRGMLGYGSRSGMADLARAVTSYAILRQSGGNVKGLVCRKMDSRLVRKFATCKTAPLKILEHHDQERAAVFKKEYGQLLGQAVPRLW